jgi:hypothetical protein
LSDFHSQSGYGVFLVSQSNVAGVVDCIRNQQQHHRHLTFQDECRAFDDTAILIDEGLLRVFVINPLAGFLRYP